MSSYYQPEIETMPRDGLQALQLERLKALVAYVYERIPFYREAFDAAGVKPSDINALDDLSKLPFTAKQDLRDAYPFKMFAVGRDDVVRIHASSGTTGNATVVGYTQNDLKNWGDCFGRFLVAAGATTESVVQVAYGYGLFTGGLGAHQGAEAVGCTVVPMSSGNTKRQVQFMKDFDTDILCCTPSYALLIADTALEEGFTPATDFKISAAVLGAEPCSEGMRQEIQTKLGLKMLDIYGLSEVMGPGVACECGCQKGLHVCEDHFIVEIVDPDTLEPVPDGTWGEAVFTTLTKECSPLIRYRTRDITRIIEGTCECGRSFRRIDRITGRTDDMLIIRGVNVFPSQIEEVITKFDEITAQYQIVLSSKGPLDHVELLVETVPEYPFDEVRRLEALRKRLAAELKSNLQVSIEVRIVEPKTIVRSEGKAKRILDLRERG
ncbi:MAG: phenylacetate--CoA ligase [Coriobacteriaceae bacterium]|jgi:phenylacetate-CoA ligase|nr:phenylacetate--CoA ligase [Coriobacteriaceae bacterium]